MRIPMKLNGPSDITLADRARDVGEWLSASRLYERALRRNPHNAPVLVQYGHALKESGRLHPAEMAYRKAIAWGTGTADTYVQLGHVLKLQGKLEEARAAYLVGLVLDPTGNSAAQELEGIGWPTERLTNIARVAAKSAAPVVPTAEPAAAPPPNGAGRLGKRLITAEQMDGPFVLLLARLRVRDEVNGSPIHPQDNMRSPGREEHYYSVGLDALWNIILSMMSSGLTDAHRILDFPSGFGRVTRYLRAAFPDAQIDVGDTWAAAVTHCAATYRANSIQTKPRFRDIDAPNYDVIFCGSLLTHLAEEVGNDLLDFFVDHLEVGGIVVVTFCGQKNLLHEKRYFNEAVFGTRENLERIAAMYQDGQYGFMDYPGQSGYGRAFVPIPWFQRYGAKNPQLIITRIAEGGWDNNQDVATLKRVF
jgi:hypothetical protein